MKESNIDKQQLSEARRLESIKQRRREKSSQQKQISASLRKSDIVSSNNNVIKFNFHNDEASNIKADDHSNVHEKGSIRSTKLSLLESSGSEAEDDDEKRFRIKPQFEGERGRQLFEMSSSIIDERFKLDERFEEAELFVGETLDDDINSNDADENPLKYEKDKNLAILEQVLGFKMPQKPPNAEQTKKRKYIRFDPESENASNYIRKPDSGEKNTVQAKKKKIEVPAEPEPVVSKKKFFEVTTDLKNILHATDGPLSAGFKFNFTYEGDIADETNNQDVHEADIQPLLQNDVPTVEKRHTVVEKQLNEDTGRAKSTFFFRTGEPRLQEGVHFFRRSKPMEEIREEWSAMRDVVMDMLKKNKRVAQKEKIASRTVQQQKFGKKSFKRRR